MSAAFTRAASEVAAAFAGETPLVVERFTTGAAHFVFEARFSARPAVVVRLSRPENRQIALDAAALSHRLRPLGVPLPAILAEGLDAPLPYLILERLPGRDLGNVIASLQPARMEEIASKLADVQTVVANSGSEGRYGFAVEAGRAPFFSWSDVLYANLARSRWRLTRAGLFELSYIERVWDCITSHLSALEAIPATPFLHDTTTRNVIVTEDGKLSGIVDVDDLCFGDPRFVVALTLTSVLNLGGPVGYVDAWLHHAGFEKDGIFWLYVALFALDFMAEHGHDFNGNQPVSTKESRAHLQSIFEDAIALAAP